MIKEKCVIFVKALLKFIPDWLAISISFRRRAGYFPNLRNPRTFNEKLQWLKLHDRKPIYTKMVDKYEAKKIVSQRIGEKYIIPTLGVWKRFEDIEFDKLPNQFVLKTTHDSGCVIVVKDKNHFDSIGAKKKMNRRLKRNFYYEGREWPYKNVKPQIIAEKYMEDRGGIDHDCQRELIDYKFYCFNGEPKFLYVSIANFQGLNKHDLLSYLNLDWTPTPFSRPDHPQMPFMVEKPAKLQEMIEVSRKLSQGIPFVRIDLYYINEEIYFSEFTFTPGGGIGFFQPPEWEERIGQWLDLPVKNKND